MVKISTNVQKQNTVKQNKTYLADFRDKGLGRRLNYIYSQIPSMVYCDKCAKCCFMSAEVHYIEYLNILGFIKELPKKVRDRYLKNILSHELLNLTTHEYQCPFLLDMSCSIYDHRPISCRVFGIYPEDDYNQSRKDTLTANREIALEFKKYYDVDLPSEVIEYDVDQCGKNLGLDGLRVVITKYERGRLRRLIVELEKEVSNQALEEQKGESASFTNIFLRSYLSDSELHNIKLAVIRAYREGRFNEEMVQNIIKQYKMAI